ncbi:unnamed protein product [Spirodela intermedia]|uniref:Protein FAR1-RELATED SEQUENCE n=1 Tax=Spirodela intermedia TaxID=51605 RepID=A0A7I8JHU6_SPIIN|nr:unnamed protein product [Spirodela intermedia]CAA6669708.1 unnamed protein product [Spirodela intermedia]
MVGYNTLLDRDLPMARCLRQMHLIGKPEPCHPDPAVGMAFGLREGCLEYYNQYARKVGFSVRWDCKTVSRKTGLTMQGCSREDRDLFAKYHREDTRCGCPAFMKIKLAADDRFHISDCNTAHNHELATPHYVHMLRSQRPDDGGGDSEGLGMEAAAVSQSMSQQAVDSIDDGMMQQLQVDCRNYLPTRRMTGCRSLTAMGCWSTSGTSRRRTRSLFYSFQMRVDFNHFGDVICFDTTYKMNDYGRPLQLTVFGVALLYDETVDSFRWVFRTLLEAMGGRMPVTLLTDEAPLRRPPLCVWHLYQWALKNLAHIFSGAKSFDDDLGKCLFDCELEADLFEAWNAMLVKYSSLRTPGCSRSSTSGAVGGGIRRSTFCADIRSSQRAESLTRELRTAVTAASSAFFARFERFLEGKRRQELEANFRMTQSQPYVPPVSIIKHAARVYTSSVFYMFMAEYVVGLECLIKNEEVNGQVRVLTVEDGRRHEYLVRVDLQEQVFGCSCQRFEFAGVLCGHVLACITDDLRVIPDRYVLKRWTRAAAAPASRPPARPLRPLLISIPGGTISSSGASSPPC